MHYMRLLLNNAIQWCLQKILFLWSDGRPHVCKYEGFPITVLYNNGEVEVLPLDTDIKISTDGTVYLKDKKLNKWAAYPEIVELLYTRSHHNVSGVCDVESKS